MSGLAGLSSFWRLWGIIHFLAFLASRGCPYSLGHGSIPLEPGVAGQVVTGQVSLFSPFTLVSLTKMLSHLVPLALVPLLKIPLFLRTYILPSIPPSIFYVLSDLNLLKIVQGRYSYQTQVRTLYFPLCHPLWISPEETAFSWLVSNREKQDQILGTGQISNMC